MKGCRLEISLININGLFTLETDHPSKTAYPLDNSRQTNNTS